ncbi:hypothetical protein C499_01340 [Halogeometricum borinquense DSM 11551]|uniref:Uncharacterized protein n=2 Tax=Halogeometricum borinquense TaxID=60847 RepID=E4NLX8_HALBP|nr:hypothetical protein [Halogeometricum borinquense]ADQ68428.1 hypothetical protein Hbor_28880 [Halogeometricum borinquense DSM 11551]ELY31390.1 hypothetical protein C499_01340 [Halogeometricum borinquense DSM 11551]RYJ15232.1 hypothetical protein ELS19_15625 [Halogeometricum borinquense]
MQDSPPPNRIADVHYVACRECGCLVESVKDPHLTGRDCTGSVTTREEYCRKYPEAPVVTRSVYRNRSGSE